MKTYAYDELYLRWAQRILGDMYDYAVNTLNYSIESFCKMFIGSNIAHQFETGNPAYVAGMNGCELAREVVFQCGYDYPDTPDIMYVDKSAEFWIGWSLAYYQWYSSLGFFEINLCVPISEMYKMYPTYHEMDIEAFVETMNERTERLRRNSALKRLRKYAELSQSQLSKKSGVPIRQIQLFEQGQRDINKTQGDTLLQLSKALGCEIESLLQ